MRPIIPAVIAILAAGGVALAAATPAFAYSRIDDASIRGADVRAAAEEAPAKPWGSITFRSERYGLSDRAVVSTTPTTIRILDDSAANQQGKKTSLYVQLGYSLDPNKPKAIRVNSGLAIRGYDFATGAYDQSQAIQLGPGVLSVDSPYWPEATHALGPPELS